MNRFNQLIFCAILLIGCKDKESNSPAIPVHGEFVNEEIKVNNETRVYRLFVPESVDLTIATPLVFAFHGLGIDSKDLMPVYTQLNVTAKTNKFILVYPNAIGGSWALDADKTKKDIDFFDALLLKIASVYKIDSKRIYVLGMSNGGYFAHLIGKERSTAITAVASHSGPLGLQTLGGIKADRKFPVIILNGDKDQLFAPSIFNENTQKYQNEGHDVKHMELANTGHEWGTSYHVNDSIWAFFSKYKLP